mmetsp:Transcript_34586/g.83875  ORF Transcript_34586/g.83875 Transcript_34586/m.83875 type:complete len:259 (+) Transcript_34586:221-997(+)
MDEMDALWLPIIKTWRLNERMYGSLTGLSKQMVKQKYGEKQFKAWRRGYGVKPPAVSSFSPHYPGNDKRYQKYLQDKRYSLRETLIRSIESGELKLQRKLPKSESLRDCMERTIPYFVERIAVDAVDQGKRVLISSSENAIRGLLMHLLDIEEEEITGLEIPNGLPLIYDVKSKCLKVRTMYRGFCFVSTSGLTLSFCCPPSCSTMALVVTHWRCTTLEKQGSISFAHARMRMAHLTRSVPLISRQSCRRQRKRPSNR